MTRLVIILALFAALSGCAKLPGFGGPKIAANVPIGKEVEQTGIAIGDRMRQTVTAPKSAPRLETIRQDSGPAEVRTERVERIEVRNEAPWWVWLIALLGWLLPSPQEMAAQIMGIFKREPKGSSS